MKVRIVLIGIIVLSLCAGVAAALSGDDINDHRSCNHCGMDRKAYGYSRMLVIYEDGAQVGVCSLNCAVTELNEHKGQQVKSLLVADRESRKLIDAEKANWVMGGKKRGVMTQRPKWAFETEAGAESFVKTNGGKRHPWQEVLAAAREDAGAGMKHK
jgi:nitrous oxide reductase accessory protein NosL